MTPEEIANVLREYERSQRSAAEATDKAAEANRKIEGATLGAMQMFEKLYNAGLKYQLQIAKGEKGASAFNDGLDAMTEAAQAAAVGLSLLIPGGPVVKAVAAGLTFLATTAMKTANEFQKLANQQADATYKAFQAFSKAGATASDGLSGLFRDVNRMRLNVHQLDAMAGVMAESAKEMSAMGGTVYRGRKEFANLTENLKPFEQGMLNLGLSYDEQASAIMGFMKLQANISRGSQRDYGNLTQAAQNYIKETEALTRITGLNRQEQEKILERQMSNQRSGAVLAQLEREGKTEAANLLRQQGKIYAQMGPTYEKGFNDILSGMVNTEEARKLLQVTQGKIMQDQNDIMEGRIRTDKEAMEATHATTGVMKGMQEDMGELFKAGVGEEVLGPFQELTNAAKIHNGEMLKRFGEAQNEVDTLTGTVSGADTQLTRYTNLIIKQNEQMLAMQQKMNGAFSDAGSGVSEFQRSMKELTDDLMNAFGPLIKVVYEVVDIMAQALEGAVRGTIKVFGALITLVQGDYTKAWNEFTDGLSLGWDKISSAGKRLVEPIVKLSEYLENLVHGEGGGPILAVINAFKKAAEIVGDFGGMLLKGVKSFNDILVDGITQVWNKLASMIPGMDTIKSVAKTVGGAVSGAVSAVTGGGAPAPSAKGTSTAGGGRGSYSGYSSGGGGTAASGGTDEAGGKPPADKEVQSAGADDFVQMGQQVKVGNQIRQGGTVSWRTNNPGNMSWSGLAKSLGAIGTWKKLDGDEQQRTTGIAIFPNLDMGDNAKMAQWRRPMYINKTIDQGVQQWTGTLGPGSGYAKDLARAAGATLDTVIGQLTDSQLKNMITKQRVWEGFKEGQVKQAANGGIFDGPKSGYPMTLHGPEAVIPLKDGAVPVAMSQEFNMTAANLNELVNIMKDNVSMQDAMLDILDQIRRTQITMADNTGKMVAMAA